MNIKVSLFMAALLMTGLTGATAQTNQNAVAVVGDTYGVHCSSYTYQESQDYIFSSAPEHDVNSINWQDGVGGSSFAANTNYFSSGPYVWWLACTWPAGSWPNPLPYATATEYRGGNYVMTNQVYPWIVGGGPDGAYVGTSATSPRTGSSFTWNFLTGMTLTTGGSAGSTAKNIFEVSVNAITQTNAEPPNPDHVPWYPDSPFVTVSSEQISVGVFGKLDDNGNAYAVLPDNTNVDVTPAISGNDDNNYHITPSKYTLNHIVWACSLPIDRTTIGIGEVVSLNGMPDGTVWSVSGGGSVSPTNGSSTTFTAGLTPTNATVHAKIENADLTQDFTILAPSSITVVSNWDNPLGTNNPNGTIMRAETFYRIVINPTNVDFSNVSFRENVSPIIIHWPCGIVETNIPQIGFPGVPCGHLVNDDILVQADASMIFDGTNYVDFSFPSTWTDQYQDNSGNWVDFQTLSVTREFNSNKQAHVIYMGIPGGWQGPY